MRLVLKKDDSVCIQKSKKTRNMIGANRSILNYHFNKCLDEI